MNGFGAGHAADNSDNSDLDGGEEFWGEGVV